MNTFSAYLFRSSLPPQQQEIQEIRADIILIHPIVIDHPTQTLNRENPDISILLKNEMRDFLHESIRVVERWFVGACVVHDLLRVEDVELYYEVCHDLEGYHEFQFVLLVLLGLWVRFWWGLHDVVPENGEE